MSDKDEMIMILVFDGLLRIVINGNFQKFNQGKAIQIIKGKGLMIQRQMMLVIKIMLFAEWTVMHPEKLPES